MFGFIVILFMTPSGHSWIINKINGLCSLYRIFCLNNFMVWILEQKMVSPHNLKPKE